MPDDVTIGMVMDRLDTAGLCQRRRSWTASRARCRRPTRWTSRWRPRTCGFSLVPLLEVERRRGDQPPGRPPRLSRLPGHVSRRVQPAQGRGRVRQVRRRACTGGPTTSRRRCATGCSSTTSRRRRWSATTTPTTCSVTMNGDRPIEEVQADCWRPIGVGVAWQACARPGANDHSQDRELRSPRCARRGGSWPVCTRRCAR